MPQDGSGPATQITAAGDVYKYDIAWSPDGKKILWADKKLRLQYVDVESKAITLVAEATAFEFSDYAWSPDSRWIAYAKPEEESMTRVYLYSLGTSQTIALTDGWFSSVRTFLQCRWEVPVLCLEPFLQPVVRADGVQLRLLRYGENLSGHSRQGDPLPVRAKER